MFPSSVVMEKNSLPSFSVALSMTVAPPAGVNGVMLSSAGTGPGTSDTLIIGVGVLFVCGIVSDSSCVSMVAVSCVTGAVTVSAYVLAWLRQFRIRRAGTTYRSISLCFCVSL